MESVGHILSSQREKKKFTLDDVHKFIKIHPKFLRALEDGDYEVFSDKIHAKGFLKSYSEFLGLDTKKLLAVWRREYEGIFDKREKKTEKKKESALSQMRLLITPGLVVAVSAVVFIILFFGYLFYQYKSYSGAPRLEIHTPKNSIVVSFEILDVTGVTDEDSVLMINNQRVILGSDGSFVTPIRLREGINTLNFLVVNKLGKETKETRTIVYRRSGEDQDTVEATESTESEALIDF